MTVRVYKSTMTGAPTMSGSTAGGVLGVLNACLLNGFNSVSVSSITRSGTTVTVNATAHGFSMGDPAQARRGKISGANETDYNIEFTVASVPTANQFTFEIATTPASPATGTISCRRAEAGWGSPFTGTNKAVYRAASGNRFYLRVDDTATTVTGSGVAARVVGYEIMTDVDTGTGDFPTAAQVSGGDFVPRSSAANGTARAWTLYTSATVLILFVDYAGDTYASAKSLYFGDILSYKSGDAYHTTLIAQTSSSYNVPLASLANFNFTAGQVTASILARAYTQIGTAVTGCRVGSGVCTGIADSGAATGTPITYPNGPDGGLYINRHFVLESGNHIRGELPAVYFLQQSGASFSNGDTFSGTGAFAGKQFMMQKCHNGAAAATVTAVIEISDTW